MKGLLIAGTASGVGKTTVSLALMAALKRRGLAVQPFKCGPDFLDAGHHTRICGRIARNLDTWMLSAEANEDVLQDAGRGANVVVAEAMMGLFDGKSGRSEAGSSAEIAKLLRLPVVLVVDAAKSARSIAAVILGFELFDPQLLFAGVILNSVTSERHYEMLRAAIESSCKTKILGWLPYEPKISIPERHLGLLGAEQMAVGGESATVAQIDELATLAEQYFDVDGLLELECGLTVSDRGQSSYFIAEDAPSVRVGIASDLAFSFYYEDNLDLLRELGAEIIRFSPMNDMQLPPRLDAIYLGGGYPELYAEELSGNRQMLESIRNFAESGKPVYAECGGMLYLSQSLTDAEGKLYPMAGLLPLSMEMTGKLVQFGYVTVEFMEDCLLGPKGTMIRGHSFHYSRIASRSEIETRYRVQYSMSGKEEQEGFHYENILASYIHFHFRANPIAAKSFIAAVRRVRLLQEVTA